MRAIRALATLVGWVASIGVLVPVHASPLAARQAIPEVPGPRPISSPAKFTGDVSKCQGYSATDVQTSATGLTARLNLIGEPCNAYAELDFPVLDLVVNYDTLSRLHVSISDAEGKALRVDPEVLSPPEPSSVSAEEAMLRFDYVAEPFSFSVIRKDSEEVLFDTAGEPLIFEDQYLYLSTKIPEEPFLYGLGQHNDPFLLNSTDYNRTLWNRDAPGLNEGTNLYGSHPIYHDHRLTEQGAQTHGVALINSHGMKVRIDGGRLAYNVLGGIFDLYFFAGPEPAKITEQYHELIGLPLGTPYWGLGLHQCRWGYADWIDVAQVVANYSEAGIPLETMWSDIDYMDHRAVFTSSPTLYPRSLYRQVVDSLHHNKQRFVMMVDPAVAVREYGTYNRGAEQDVFIKRWDGSGSYHNGVVWPGRTVFPDWYHPNTTQWWIDEFKTFFDPNTGYNIDALWIDMNEPASFLPYIDANPDRIAVEQDSPPKAPTSRAPPYPIEGIPGTFPPSNSRSNKTIEKRVGGWEFIKTYPDDPSEANLGDKYMYPPYNIGTVRKDDITISSNLSDFTNRMDLTLYGGRKEYANHNVYGAMMAKASQAAMQARRPGKKGLILSRSTFIGSSSHTGVWLGDNLSTWEQMRQSIRHMLGFSIYGIPMVGSDICGFGGNTTETLCARWAMTAILHPFYRNHNEEKGRPHEFYRFPLTQKAAKAAVDIRYRLLDAMYTSFRVAETKGTPVVEPLFWRFPDDRETFSNENQYLSINGSILVSPVINENSTSVEAYIPGGAKWYTFDSWEPVPEERVGWTTFEDVDYDEIPMHVRGGSILPLRAESGMTTSEVRGKPFNVVIAPDRGGEAYGELYLDDGESLKPASWTLARMAFSNDSLVVEGEFGFDDADVNQDVRQIVFLGQDSERKLQIEGGESVDGEYDAEKKVLRFNVGQKLGAMQAQLV